MMTFLRVQQDIAGSSKSAKQNVLGTTCSHWKWKLPLHPWMCPVGWRAFRLVIVTTFAVLA